jgi:hypothetical protein
MRSAKAPTIRPQVMAAKAPWKATKINSGSTTPLLKVAATESGVTLQEQLVEAAEEGVALGEGHAVAIHRPQHADQREHTNTCISTDSMFLAAHQAAVEQRQAGDAHQDDEGRGDHQPGVVALVGHRSPGRGGGGGGRSGAAQRGAAAAAAASAAGRGRLVVGGPGAGCAAGDADGQGRQQGCE